MLLSLWGFFWPVEPYIPALWLNFEPPNYSPGELDGQDEWEQIHAASGYNMEITNDPAKVIYQTQSLQVNIPADTWDWNSYKREIVPMRSSSTNWSMYADNNSDGPSCQLGWWGPGMVSITLITFYTNGWISVEDADGITGIGPYDISDPHTFSFTVSDNGSTTLMRDAIEIYTGMAQGYAWPDMQPIWLMVEGKNQAGTTNTQFFVDDFKEYDPTILPQLSVPTNVFAIRRDNYILVSWDRVRTYTNRQWINGRVDRYEVLRFNSPNEFNPTLVQKITTLDTSDNVDTVFRDTNIQNVHGYQIRAVLNVGPFTVQSTSDTAMVVKLSSSIDDSTERIDQKIFTLDKSILDEHVLG